MYIDTATANTQSSRPHVIVTPSRNPSPYNDSHSPRLEASIPQGAPPPTYLEATTPGLSTARLSGDEGARLLSFDGRQARDATLKADQYRQRSLRQQCLEQRWLKWIIGIVLAILLVAMLAAMFAAVTAQKDKQVRTAGLHTRDSFHTNQIARLPSHLYHRQP